MNIVPPPDPANTVPTVTLASGRQLRVLVADQVGRSLRTARVRWVPVAVEMGGRAGTTVQTRLLPAVRDTGQRLGPVATSAVLRAGTTVHAVRVSAVDRGAPVTREAARRGLNAWAALLGGQPAAVTAAPTHRRARTAGWILTVGALTGGGYSAWRLLRAADNPRQDAENPWQDEPAPDWDPVPAATPATPDVPGPELVDSESTDLAASAGTAPVVTDPTESDASPGRVTAPAAEPAEPLLGPDAPTDT